MCPKDSTLMLSKRTVSSLDICLSPSRIIEMFSEFSQVRLAGIRDSLPSPPFDYRHPMNPAFRNKHIGLVTARVAIPDAQNTSRTFERELHLIGCDWHDPAF